MPDMEGLEPINLETTPGIIADRIRTAITQGTFPAGAQLGESQLAEQLNVSRGSVREALQRLVQEGLLHNQRHRGVFVTTLDETDFHDIYLVRGAIERQAVRILIRRNEGRVPAPLAEILDRMSALADEEALVELDLEFHELLVASSGSKRLNRMFRTLLVESLMCVRALESAHPNRRDLVAEHRRLLEALEEQDEERALHLLDAHMEEAVADLTGG